MPSILFSIYSFFEIYGGLQTTKSNLESLLKTKKTLKRDAVNLQRLYDTCQEKVLMLYKTIGSYEQKIENINVEWDLNGLKVWMDKIKTYILIINPL